MNPYYISLCSIVIAAFALFISAATAWQTLFRKGTVKMIRPSTIFFGPDGGTVDVEAPKVYLRALLFSTAKRGSFVEAMYASITRNESRQNFSTWVLGEDRLSRGSGLFVGSEGVLANHHFLAPKDSNNFRFIAGTYRLDVYASLVGESTTLKLFSEELTIEPDQAKLLLSKKRGIHFDWVPDAGRYIPHIEGKPNTNLVKGSVDPRVYEDMITQPIATVEGP